MLPDNTIEITIDGVSLNNFSHLKLEQPIYDHHHFQVIIGSHILETPGSHTINKSKDWVGKLITITMAENTFIGIVTSINMAQSHGHFGNLVIEGYSKTILLESMPHFFSWTDKSLKDIVQDVIGRSGISAQVSPEFSGQIPYLAQHQESNFAFLRRIANQYHEWMYYDGEELIFGKPGSMPDTELAYGPDIEDIQVSVKMNPIRFGGFAYNSLNDEFMNAAAPDSVSGLGELGDHGLNASKENFGYVPTFPSPLKVEDQSGLGDILKKMQAAHAADMSKIHGKGTHIKLAPGVVANITAKINQGGNWESKPYGNYLITSVYHEATGNNEYLNHFEAIPADVSSLPAPKVHVPIASPQLGIVLSNEDPESKGRIQVQLQWQMPEGLNTNWLRVMTPDGGVSDNVGQNRGYVFIPETGDQVMVGFRQGDPSRPFVMGSMFHGNSGAGGKEGNNTKSIITKSGNVITFDDEKESITISDAKQNLINLDGQGNISAQSSASIQLGTGDSSIVLKSDGTISISGKKIQINGEDEVLVTSKKATVDGSEEVKINSAQKVDITASNEVAITGTAKATISSSATTAIQGTIIKLN